MIVKNFGCEGNIYCTGQMLEKLPPQITETVAGPTRQFAPIPPGGIVTEPLPEIKSDWVDFYKNVTAVLEGREESKIKIPEVRRALLSRGCPEDGGPVSAAVTFYRPWPCSCGTLQTP